MTAVDDISSLSRLLQGETLERKRDCSVGKGDPEWIDALS